MRRRRNRRENEKLDYWQSYSDVLTALILIFVLMLFVSLESYSKIKSKYDGVKDEKFRLDEIQAKYNEAQKEVNSMKKEVEKIIGVKTEIIKELKEEFGSSVYIDSKTGDIQFEEKFLMGYKQTTLTREGKKKLKKFLNTYLNVLLSDKYRDYVSEICIEGHTDTVGSYKYNLNLSQERALSVAIFCLDNKEIKLSSEQKKVLRKVLTANGRSFSDPIYKSNGKIDDNKSRRVVFKFRVKDEEMIKELQQMLSDIDL